MSEVMDRPSQGRLESVVDGQRAEFSYRVEDRHLILSHTEVPAMPGGRAIGGRLVRAVVDRAEWNGLAVAPW
jgi:predicted GNAT family acetyltransferase